MKKTRFACIIAGILALAIVFPFHLPSSVHAAQLYGGDNLSFSPTDQLRDAYIAGSTIAINAPVANDLSAAGGVVTVNNDVENSANLAGGNLAINGNIGHSLRAAGGTITVKGDVGRDALIFGGEVIIDRDSRINNDLIVSGGTITINGEIAGRVQVNCDCIVTLNGTVGSLQSDHLRQLIIGEQAQINGDLNYTAPREADIHDQATIAGETTYQPYTPNQSWRDLATAGFFYNILAGLIFCFVLLYLLRQHANFAVQQLRLHPLPTLAWGFGTLFLFPVVALIAAILAIWLGIASFIAYLLFLLVGFYLAQLLLGWWMLWWWFGRNNEQYQLDWRAVIVGVGAATLLMLVPVVGWIIMLLMLAFAIGSLSQAIWNQRYQT